MSSFPALTSLPEDHLQCSICLNVFTDPVTTPCGHSFCRTCLSEHWDRSDLCHCPKCNKRFHLRPEISTNVVIDEISFQIKRRRCETMGEGGGGEEAWRVPCDVCLDVKMEAMMSCLVCLTSFCQGHLEPHQRVPSLMRHELVDPVENLEERICQKHSRLLEFFCRDEGVCICLLCSETEHKQHHLVTVQEEATQQKENLESKKVKIKLMIESRVEKMKEFTEASEIRREKATKEIDDSVSLFTSLIDRVQEAQIKLKWNIEDKLKKSQEKDEAMVQRLQQEIDELQKKGSELDELSQSDDHLLFLQALNATSVTRDWSKVRVYSDLCVQTVRRAMNHLVHTFQTELKTLTETEVTKMRQYKEVVTFDPSTAGCRLMVTEFRKRLKYKKESTHSSSDDLDGLDYPMILGSKGFTCGRHYWEVQVGRRNDWDVGIAKETVDRTGKVALTPENGVFAVGKRGYDYRAHQTPIKVLNLCPRPRSIGVYLDYNEGRVSFYDVDLKMHIFSFRQKFTEKLFPYFYLYSRYKKSEALVITFMYDEALFLSSLRNSNTLKVN